MITNRSIFLFGVICWFSLVHIYGQELLEGHTDIMFTFSVSTGQWSGNFVDGEDFVNPNKNVPFDQASLPMIDQMYDPFTGVGDRETAFSGDEFIGVLAGDPFWLLPQSNAFPRNYTWPGFRSQVAPNTFRSYQPVDSRISSSQRWITHTLTDVIYAGQSMTPGHFSAFQYDLFGSPIIWMASSDGIDSSDVFYLDENGHAHTNYGFSQLGIYRVGLRASAILDVDGSTVVSNTEYITFAVGTLATWLADHFGGLDLVDSQVTGMDADGEDDGVDIKHEYAFNLNPVLSDRHYLTRDTGTSGLPIGWVETADAADRLHVQFLRRKGINNPQIQYIVEFNNDLGDPQGWLEVGSESVTSIDEIWERVTVTDTESVLSESNRFARVRILVQESISY